MTEAETVAIQENEEWRQKRDQRCRAPDGWLSLAGLHWLKDGDNIIGGSDECTVRFEVASLQSRIGVVTVAGERLTFKCDASAASDVQIDGVAAPADNAVELSWDSAKPTAVTHGTLTWFVKRNNDQFALRLKDSASPVLKHYNGIDMYPIDLKYRVKGKWLKTEPPEELRFATAVGGVDIELSYGSIEFELDGKTCALKTCNNPAESDLELLFEDLTTRKTTYGGGRFVWCKPPDSAGNVVLDFNQAYNPPCVFTPFCTCPRPLASNKLPVAIEAGEKTYGDH